MRRIACIVPLVALGCTPRDADMTGFGVGSGGMMTSQTGDGSSSTGIAESSSSTSTGSTSTSAGDTSTSAASTGAETPPDFGPPGPKGCHGKIDFLFVISSSGTMSGYQQQLLEAFPAFYSAIETQFADFDTHILVSDTDAWWNMGDCGLCTEDCEPFGSPPLCGAELTGCDSTMGAGVTFPAGKDSSARRCDFADGRRYITRDEPDPLATFLCAAQLGSGGAPDHPAEAMVEALGPALNGPGGCNEGFLRDDALLVVTIIADGYDNISKGWPEKWVSKLMEAKHGDGDAFLVMVLSTDIDLPAHLEVCPDPFPGQPKPRLRELVELVPHGMYGSICLDDYGPFFAEGAARVLELCEAFIPQ